MQSLKGEPRHYAVAVVHGPLPYHPFDSPPSPVAFFFLLSRSLSYSLALSLFSMPDQRRALLPFLFHKGESFATVYTYPNGIRHSLDSKPIQWHMTQRATTPCITSGRRVSPTIHSYKPRRWNRPKLHFVKLCHSERNDCRVFWNEFWLEICNPFTWFLRNKYRAWNKFAGCHWTRCIQCTINNARRKKQDLSSY